MTKKIVIFFIGYLAFSLNLSAQDIPLANGEQYTVGEITVTGNTGYNEQTVIAFTGLRKGEKIYIPGDRISQVINKLWDLGLFSDINLYYTISEGNVANLELEIQEVPELNEVTISGNKKKKHKEKFIKKNDLDPGTKVTENLIATTRNNIEEFYSSEGYLNADVDIRTIPVQDTLEGSTKQLVDLDIDINVGEKVKISAINIEGNEVFSDGKVRRQMSTKRKNFLRFWKRSKFIEEDYEEDKQEIIKEYKSEGYRDARIISDSIIKKDEENIAINLKVEEGDKYYFGDISFLGNSVYTDKQLKQVLKIKKGDTYNGTLLEQRIADQTKPDADDLTNLYQNNGYLFSQINAVETRVYNDTIDFEIRIREGKVAYFDEVVVKGNDKTNDHVIYRNLRTRPGERYSKRDVVRTVRELGQLGFFDAQKLAPEFKNVNPNDGTLDLEYNVIESGASQIELQGGYGGGGFVGTLGLSFNNFSLKGIFDKDAYHPLPMGDGQTLSLRAQAANFYQTYSLSFSEPWLGGKEPIRLTTSFSHTVQYFYDAVNRDANRDRRFLITGGSVGLAKRLTIPDDYFTVSSAVSYQHYSLKNYDIGLFNFPDGHANNFAITLGLTRNNQFTNPIYPKGGSEFSITAKFTPPYSLWNGVDYGNLENNPAYQTNGQPDPAKIDQKRFDWLEYYKIKFKGDWYNSIVGDLVLRTNVEYGFLGAYNNERGIPPFERFYLGGDGLGGYSLDGRETIRLRGYPNQSLTPIDRDPTSGATRNDGATIYNKYSLELRYPITLNRSASIYGLAFAEGGASYDGFRDFNPFQLNRSAGFGVRIFMPAFGLLGIDFGYGFDPIPGTSSGESSGWRPHFIIGQQF
ncbi:BamA/OMP85 family outer membrane protein [Mesonia maritima]|uniref:Outer membrane protein insertion porin family n=1 Tax=Mesonia maritima TaxID=1793873 RepID=A0ABU1K3K9_9FLAO|nr:POTRA domain-containing protein [Mesonia maritima]MDR6300200.1 outer membrane protein insertion porin family [Mesonia maritima]